MKAIILAGGYGTRLLPLTKHIPKPLLPVAGKPVIDYLIEQLNEVSEIDEIIVSTNKLYESNFKHWLRGIQQNPKAVKVVSDWTKTEKEKMGAIRSLQYIIDVEKLHNEDLLVIAGDNVFEFSLRDLVDYYKKLLKPVMALHDLCDVDKSQLSHFGLGITDEHRKIIGFQEKPREPRSSCVATGCYVYPRDVQPLLQEYLADKNNPDAPGYFIEWLHKKIDTYAFIFSEAWYDIGSLESYDSVNEYFRSK